MANDARKPDTSKSNPPRNSSSSESGTGVNREKSAAVATGADTPNASAHAAARMQSPIRVFIGILSSG